MLESFKNHPFGVEAFFESSLVLTFAVPKEQLQSLIPECLQLDTFQDRWGFVAMAMVQTRNLRPKGFPRWMGHDFFLIGYRIFVRYHNKAGKRLRGLYILKSETNKKMMAVTGNIFTHYNYTTTDVQMIDNKYLRKIISHGSKVRIEFDTSDQEVPLPENSPFQEWKLARRFAGPLPFTFTYNTSKKEVLIIEGVRQNWKPRPINVISHEFGFLKSKPFKNAVLANAFVVENIPYEWKKGILEPWKPSEENFKEF